MAEIVAYSNNNNKSIILSNERRSNLGIPFIPEGIIFDILVRLPARTLYNSMRFVCKTWYNIIRDHNFVREHLLHSPAGLIEINWDKRRNPLFITMEKKMFRSVELDIRAPLVFTQTGCDGLLLFSVAQERDIYVVMNPVTRELKILPRLPSLSMIVDDPIVALVYAPSTKRYKVVLFYGGYQKRKRCSIVTVGIDDEWRELNTERLSETDGKSLSFRLVPSCIENLCYLFTDRYAHQVVLDVDTENVRVICAPQDWPQTYREIVPMGNSFTLLFFLEAFVWEVWVLKDPKNGEWVKHLKIDLNSRIWELKRILVGLIRENSNLLLSSIAWFENGQVLILRPYTVCADAKRIYIAINVKTGEILKYHFLEDAFCFYLANHVNSLVSLTC